MGICYVINHKTLEHRQCDDRTVGEDYPFSSWRIVVGDAEGWIPHSKGSCPLPPDQLCEVKLSEDARRAGTRARAASEWTWGSCGACTIVAYRPVFTDQKLQAAVGAIEEVPHYSPEVKLDFAQVLKDMLRDWEKNIGNTGAVYHLARYQMVTRLQKYLTRMIPANQEVPSDMPSLSEEQEKRWTGSLNHVGPPSAFDTQEGGSHYKDRAVQPAKFVHSNGLGYLEGSVVYYVTRWKDKGGVGDLKKARHTLDLLIELEAENASVPD